MFECKNCGNKTAFKFTFKGKIKITTKMKSQKLIDEVNAKNAFIKEVKCRKCGHKMSEGDVLRQ
ncbi:MAG: hypothetical protein ACOCP8_06940 [archaeon]